MNRKRTYVFTNIYVKMNTKKGNQLKRGKKLGAWLVQSEKHMTLDLGVVSSSATLGVDIT